MPTKQKLIPGLLLALTLLTGLAAFRGIADAQLLRPGQPGGILSPTLFLTSGTSTIVNGGQYQALALSFLPNCDTIDTDSDGKLTCGTDGGGGGGGSVAGSATQIQYNDGGGFAASSLLTFTSSTAILSVTGLASSSQLRSSSGTVPLFTFTNATGTNLTLGGNLAIGGDTLTDLTGTGLAAVGGVLTNTGVLSITGTANQVIASASTGTITLSAPQDIGTASSPTFANTTLTSGLFASTVNVTSTMLVGATTTLSGRLSFTAASGTSLNLSSLTASKCLRIDANKNLVAASGDCASGDTDTTNPGTVATSSNLTATFIPIVTATSTIANSTLSQSGGVTFINGTTPLMDGGGDWIYNVLQNFGSSLIVQNVTGTTAVGNFTQGGGVAQTETTNRTLPGTAFCSGGFIPVNATTSITVTLPTLATLASSTQTPCASSAFWSGSFQQQFIRNISTTTNASFTLATNGAGEFLEYAPGTPTSILPGETYQIIGQFDATSTQQGANATGTSLHLLLSLYSTSTPITNSIIKATSTGKYVAAVDGIDFISSSTALKAIPFTIEYATTSDDLAVFTFDTTSTIKKFYASNKTTGDTIAMNLVFGASRATATSSAQKVFDGNITITATTTPVCYTIAPTSTGCPNLINGSTTVGPQNILRFATGGTPSSTQTHWTLYYTGNQ